MKIVALILARGGSKGIPKKNLVEIGNKSLLARAIGSCLSVLPQVYVSTDDPILEEEARKHGAKVIERPKELATDESSSEASITHAINTALADFDVVVFVQPTSPFINGEDILQAVGRIAASDVDSVFSAVEDHSFFWIKDQASLGWMPKHHEKRVRPRRQDLTLQVRETGAFYAIRVSKFKIEGTRFCGVTIPQLVDPRFAQEIDVPDDLDWAAAMEPVWDLSRGPGKPLKDAFSGVFALAYDFDGVMTPNTAILAEDGKESVVVSRSDGLGIRLLREAGFPQTIISLEQNPVVSMRANKLSISVTQGVTDKPQALAKWASNVGVELASVAFVGNDINDLDAMACVGFPIAVADADPRVKAAAKFVLSSLGGCGAIRELADLILTGTRET